MNKVICGSDSYGEVLIGIGGAMLIVFTLVGLHLLLSLPLTMLLVCTLLAWIAILVARAFMGIAWRIRVTETTIEFRSSRCGKSPEGAPGNRRITDESSIIVNILDVAAISSRSKQVLWSDVRTTTRQYLVLTLKDSAKERVRERFCVVDARGWGYCNAPIRYEAGEILFGWIWRPKLNDFMRKIQALCNRPAQVVRFTEDQPEVIDVRKFGSVSDMEQRALVRRLVQIGLGASCVLLLRRYKKLSFREASEYVARISRSDPPDEHPLS